MGASLTLPIQHGRLALGTWQVGNMLSTEFVARVDLLQIERLATPGVPPQKWPLRACCAAVAPARTSSTLKRCNACTNFCALPCRASI